MNKKRILVVEDDTALAGQLSERLVSAGFEVEVAIDGEKALQAAEKKPDLIMLDILLPKMDGISVMKEIRSKTEWGIHVPIIIASNLNPNDDKVINSVATYSPIFYLIKSEHSLEDIVEKVKEVLKFK
jgi:DNA-binding response OmpR family regulator